MAGPVPLPWGRDSRPPVSGRLLVVPLILEAKKHTCGLPDKDAVCAGPQDPQLNVTDREKQNFGSQVQGAKKRTTDDSGWL